MEKINNKRNPKIIHARKLGKDRSYRKLHNEFLCDGEKLFFEAINCGVDIEAVFISPESDITIPNYISAYEISDDIMDSISPLKNPQDIIFVCKMPKKTSPDYSNGTHILLDCVQDPGNVGTIIRSADAFGIDSIILTGSCADPYNPKTIRASMGAVFRQKFAFKSPEELSNINAKFIGTASKNDISPLYSANLKDSIIVLGNEGQGISGAVQALCGDFITIPLAPDSESLNVAIAASIVMYELSKDR